MSALEPFILIWVIATHAGDGAALTSGSQVFADKRACEYASLQMTKGNYQPKRLICLPQRLEK